MRRLRPPPSTWRRPSQPVRPALVRPSDSVERAWSLACSARACVVPCMPFLALGSRAPAPLAVGPLCSHWRARAQRAAVAALLRGPACEAAPHPAAAARKCFLTHACPLTAIDAPAAPPPGSALGLLLQHAGACAHRGARRDRHCGDADAPRRRLCGGASAFAPARALRYGAASGTGHKTQVAALRARRA